MFASSPVKTWLIRLSAVFGLTYTALAGSLMSKEERLASAKLAGDYLLRVLDEDGKFIYSVEPPQKKQDDTYNLLRHAGTIYALCQLYQETKDDRYREGAKRAAEMLLDHVHQEDIGDRTFKVLVTDFSYTYNGKRSGRVIKTGGCALAVLAFLSVDDAYGTDTYANVAQGLGQYITFTQQPTGNIQSKYFLSTQRFDDWQSNYYPGEALVALAMLQERFPNPLTAESMTRLLLYLATNWEVANLDTGLDIRDFDHWSLIGFTEAYDILDPDILGRFSPPAHPWSREKLLATAEQYCMDEMKRQLVDEGHPRDGDLVPQRGDTTPTATRLEGITSVYRLLTTAGKEVAFWQIPIERGLRFLRRGQFQEDVETNFPLDATGGVRRNVSIMARRGAEIRIDYCQHAMSAWLGYPEK